MKKIPSFSTLFTSILMVLSAVSVAWTAELSLQGTAGNYYVNMPSTGSHTVTIPSGETIHIYDNGGNGGSEEDCYVDDDGYVECDNGEDDPTHNYSDNANAYLVIQSMGGVELTGSVNTEYSYDYLRIYDNDATSQDEDDRVVLWSQSDKQQNIDPLTSDNSVTLYFYSDESRHRSGFDLTVTAVAVDPSLLKEVSIASSTNGSIESSVNNALPGKTVTLTATPSSGYYLGSVEVVDADGNPVTVSGSGNVRSFVMPETEVTVTPNFKAQPTISIASTTTNGSIESNVSFALPGQTVTLTASPSKGYYLAGVDVVDEDNNSTTVVIDGNTATFVMPENDVTVTPVFAEVSYGTNGCLAGGLYFHLECNGYSCTISQKAGTPSDDEDFACWSDLVDKIEEITEDAYSNGIVLGSDLEMGGYDGESCVMKDFKPIKTASFDGNNHVINGFCQVSSENAGFLTVYSYMSADYFENVTFTNAHVEGAVAGVLTADVTDEIIIRNVVVDGAEVIGATAGGLAGYIHHASQYGYTSMLTHVTVKNSTIEAKNVNSADSIQAGAIWGKGAARQSRMIGEVSYSINNTVKAEDAGGAVVSLGGVVGVLLTSSNDANHQYLTLQKFDISSAILKNTSAGTESNIGGFAGLFFEKIASASDSLELISFKGSISGGTNVGGIVGKVDIPSVSKLYIRNTIATTTGLQGSGNVGYIVGDIEQISAVKMYNNVYFGTDVSTLGVGNIGSLNTWLTGSDNIYANVRNVAGTLSVTGDIGHYEYHNGNANYLLYFPITSADNIARNGVALEEDLKTEMFVALMNKNSVMFGGEKTAKWSIDNAGTGAPVFVDDNNRPYYVVSIDLDETWGLTDNRLEQLGAVDGVVTIDGNAVHYTKTMIDYVASSNQLSTTFVNNVNSLKRSLAANSSGALMLMNGSGEVVNDLSAEIIYSSQKLHIEGAKSYALTYNYCTNATSCNTFESLAETKTFLFLSPKVETIETDDPVPYQILPYAFSLPNTNLKIVSVKLYDDNAAEEDKLVKTFDGSSYGTRLWQTTEITEFLRQKTADVTRIEVNYQNQVYTDDVPKITAYATDASVHVYGVDGDGESQEAFSMTDSYGSIPYGKITVSYDGTIPSRIGYNSEGMAIEYVRSIMDQNADEESGSQNMTGPLSETLTEKTFGTVDELYEKFATNHESINLVVKGLEPNDTVDINSLRIASSLADYYLSGEDLYLESHSLTVEPYYSLINYTVAFNLNLPAAADYPEGADQSGIFLGNDWQKVKENVNVENNALPKKIYKTWDGCPEMNGWKGTTGAASYALADLIPNADVTDNAMTLVANWKTADCTTPLDTIYLVYWAKNGGIENQETKYFHGSFVLRQNIGDDNDENYIDHPMTTFDYNTWGGEAYVNVLPIANDTMTFKVSATPDMGYTIGDIAFETTASNGANNINRTDAEVALGLSAPSQDNMTLTVNTALYSAMRFTVEFLPKTYTVNFDMSWLENDESELLFFSDFWKTISTQTKTARRVMKAGEDFPRVYKLEDDTDYGYIVGHHKWGAPDLDDEEDLEYFDDVLSSKVIEKAFVNDDEPLALAVNNIHGAGGKQLLEINVYAEDEEENKITDLSAIHGSLVLSQTILGKTYTQNAVADYPRNNEGDPITTDYYLWRLKMPSYGADTMTFDVSVKPDPGYTMTVSQFVGEWVAMDNETHEITYSTIPEGFGYNASAKTFTFQPDHMAIKNSEHPVEFRVRYALRDYDLTFMRPTNSNAVGVADVDYYVAEEYTAENWIDRKLFNLGSSNLEMPKLYALNGCIAWSEEASYDGEHPVYREFNQSVAQAYVDDMVLKPVYFTSENNPNLCGDAPTEYFTVTAMGENLDGLELWQIIGVTGDGDYADTVKHKFTPNDEGNTWTLNIPKIPVQEGGAETYATMNFEIHAIPADGFATYSGSYYRMSVQEGGTLTIPYEDGILTTNGSNVTFFVDVVGDFSYTLAFDTENWDHFKQKVLLGNEGENADYKLELYVADEDLDLPTSYVLGETDLKLPKLYAVTVEVDPEYLENLNHTYSIGWTIYADSAYCVVDQERTTAGDKCIRSDSKNLFNTFSGDMVVAIQKALHDGDIVADEENKIIHLYPVWVDLNSDVNNIYIACSGEVAGCMVQDSPKMVDRPMFVTLSQTISIMGEEITLTHSSDSLIVFPKKIYGSEDNFTLDVSFKVNPAFSFSSIKLIESGAEAAENASYADEKLHVINHGFHAKFVPDASDFSVKDLTVTFNLESLSDSIVAIGKSWYDHIDDENGQITMNVAGDRRFPKLYVYNKDYNAFNESFWADAAKNRSDFESDYEAMKWFYSYVDERYEYPLFNPKLVANVLDYGAETTELDLYPLPLWYGTDFRGYRNHYIYPYPKTAGDEIKKTDYHGTVVLTQSWKDQTFRQEAKIDEYDNLLMFITPVNYNDNDTLEYKVELEPDPGYAMEIDPFSFDEASGYDGEGWGYSPTTGKLKMPLTQNIVLNAKYTQLKYNVRYTIPEDANVFVVSKVDNNGVYSVEWIDSLRDVTVKTIRAPKLFNEDACRISWKVVGAREHVYDSLLKELTYMKPVSEDEDIVNTLVPAVEKAYCDTFSTFEQTLEVEGKGTIHLIQKLDLVALEEGDPTQVAIKHSFVKDAESGEMRFYVPAGYYNEQWPFVFTGIRLMVVAEPAEGYVLEPNGITYQTSKNGNLMTVTVEDSSEVNVMEPLPWKAKFSKLAPIYVTYDLSLTSADDSANTYLPPEATTAESLELASNTDTVAFWKPFQVGTCFQGWSTTAAANYTADNSAYTTFNAGNFTEFSTNPDNPTKLYAIWGDNCPENRKFWTVENETKKVKLVLYQLFGGDTLFHEVSNDYGLALEGEAFDVYVDPVKSTPKTGYRYAEDAKFSLKYQYELPLAEGSDPASETVEVEPDDENGGVWHLTSVDIPSPIYTFSTNVKEKDYLFVLDVNAGDASVFYGTDWTKKMTLTVSSNDKYFPSRLRRTDACFEGWDLVASMGNGPYSGLDDAIHVLNDIVPKNGTFITDAGEEENRDYYPLYAMWDESCEPSNYTLTTEVPASQGSFRMVQKVDDVVYAYTLDGDHPLTLPNDYTVEYDTVSFVPAAGHTLATGAQISVIYNAEDLEHGIHTFANASKYHFSDSANSEGTAVLEISSLSSDDYVLVFTENVGEGEDKPFLGDSWADFITEASFAEDANGNWTVEIGYSATSENKKFPTALYRNGKCLTGYTFAAGDNTDGAYTELSDEFMLKYAELGLENPVTLYPYWEDCDNVYTVTASDADQGVLTLKQKFAKGETEIVREYTVGAAGIALSSTNDDVTFSEVNFEPNEGSSLILDTERDYSSRADAEAEWATLAVPFTVTSNMEIKAPLLLQANFALDANAEGVFYGPDFSWNWSSENVAYDAVLPKNLYRAGYNLMGWKFDGEKDDAAKLRYDDSFAAAYMAYQAAHEGAAPDTLHAVWSRAGQVGVYTLQVSNAMQESNAGTLTFSQTIGDSTVVSTIEGGSLLVPAVEGLQLTANFAIDTAHTFDGEEPISLLSVQGNVLGTYANEGTITFDETFGAPGATIYVDVATTVDSYTFTFVVNTATEDTVFYGSNWVGKKTFSMADEANLFPISIYQTGKCLAGYAFKSTGTTTYTGIDAAFVADYKSRASKPKKLYAIWTTPETDETCSPVNVTVKSGNSGDQGVFTLTNADNTFTVSEETAITVPVAEDLDFNVTFTAQSAFGDYGDKDITVVIGKTTTKFVNGEAFKFSDPTYEAILKADVESKAVEFALNANAGDANVFYGAGYQSNWTSTTAEYDDAFPSSIYRTDAEFAGWAFTETATVGFTKFDNDFMAAYAEASAEGETAPTTLYAVWIEPETEIETATITSKSLDEGDFVVAQFVGEDSIGYSVGADGVVVPLNADLEFKAYFKADADHSLASISTPINLYVDGEETASAKIANGGVFTVTGDVAVEANTAADCYEFVFNVNAGEETVFYGSSWNESMLSTDETKAFPTSAYRTDKCLNGFAFEAENPTVTYNEISDEFLTTFKESGIPSPATLYAVWGECETTPEVYTVNVKNTLDEGAFILLNEVDGISKEYKLDKEHSLTVPAASDLKFYVSFNANNAFAYTGNINVVDLSGDVPVTLDEIEEGDAYRFTQSATLEALTTFGVVEFAYDLNAGNANVFLASDFEGLDWNVTAYGDAFPAKMTRTDKVFAGWAFTRDATVGYTAYDNEFVAAYEEFSAGRETPEEMDTLYAVWAEPEQPIETYNVVLSTLNAGVLTLSQSVAGVTQTYEVDPVGGIEIPVNGNLEYSVLFTSDFEHTVATGTPITITWIVDDLGNTEEESIANGGQFEFKGKSYVAVALDADKYELVFNVNAASTDTVFYGSEWFAKKTYDMGIEESRAFPTSIYQNGKCLAGFAFKKKNPDAVFTEVGQDFVNAYKSLSSPTKNLYAVWTTEDCDQTSVTVASANTAAEGNFTLTDAKNDYVVSADAPVTVPVAEDLSFRVAFVSGDLYKDYDSGIIGVKMGGKTAYVGNDDHYLFTVDAQLSASVTPKTVVIALDANAGSANVFYGKDYTGSWSSKNVDFDGEALLPTEGLYRTDAVLAGWAFTALADNSEEGVFTKFDKDFMAAYAAAYAEQETAPATLYAVWKTETERTTYTIASGSLDEGSLVVSQIVGEDSIGYAVSENGLTVPAESGLEFKAYFVANEGYSLAALTKPLDLYLDGSETPSKSIANGGVFEIQDNTTIKANTSSGEYEVVFDANAGDAAVFYGEAWITSIRYDMSASEIAFPTSLYRTDKCLDGFAFEAENPTVTYREINTDFLAAFRNGNYESPVTVYAVWGECETEPEVYVVSVMNPVVEGSFTLTNAAGDNSVEYTLDKDHPLSIPAAEDVKFTWEFRVNEAFGYEGEKLFSAADGSDLNYDHGAYTFTQNTKMKALLTYPEFDYDLNVASGVKLFFPNDFEWTAAERDAALPAKIYRTDMKLVGWALTATATEGFTAYDDDFVEAYAAFYAENGENINRHSQKLYAVWSDAVAPETYLVTATNLDAGELTLELSVAGQDEIYTVDESGLEIPAVENLEFAVNFELKDGYAIADEQPIKFMDGLGNVVASVENGGTFTVTDELVTAGKIVIAVDASAEIYEFAFDVNAGNATVFYGTGWFDSKTYDLSNEDEDFSFPHSIYRSDDKCLAGYAISPTETDPDEARNSIASSEYFAEAYKALETKPMKLYAVWYDCEQDYVTIASGNADIEGVYTLTNAGNTFAVNALSSLKVPDVDLEFSVAFTAGSAYEDYSDKDITITMGKTTETIGNGDVATFTRNAELYAAVTPKAVEFALDVNANDVFYGKDYTGTWKSDAGYGDDAALPTAGIYRTGAVLAGWAFAALDDDSEEGVFTKFDKDFMAAYADQETAPTKLYAVWKTEPERATYTIASKSLDAGDLTVAQWVLGDSLGYAIGEDGLKVPAESDLEFNAYFVVNLEHTLASVTKPLILLDSDDEQSIVGTITNGGTFSMTGDVFVKANVSGDVYEFAFNTNSGDATVFYGENWVAENTYDMASAETRQFPMSLYRTDKCLAGFAFDAENATTAYRELDDDFMKAFKEGEFSSPMTLYAVWDECSGDRENYTVTVENTAEEGKFVLTNAVGDIKAVYELDGSFTVPAGEDLKFAVHFEANGAYSYNNAIEVLASNGVDDIMLEQLEDGAKYGFGESVRLKAETDFSVVEFAYDLNANGANVFFSNDFEGLSWTVASYGDAFPTKIYRTGKKLAGFAFTRDATVAYTAYDNDFVSAYKEFAASREESETLDTLYAVWTADDETGTYTVTSAGTNVGVLTLSQSVSGFGGSYEIGSTGLEIPAVENLEFSMSFVADYQYTVASGKPLKLSWTDAMGVVLKDSVANGGVYEFTASTVVSVNMAADVYTFAFDVNAESADTVFYGTNWFAKKTYDLGDEELAREFPTSIYQTDKCLVGYAFESTASEENVFTKLDTDFIVAYKALDVKPKNLYAVWTTPEADETCAPAYVTLSSDNAAEEAVFTVSDAYNSYVVEPGVTINVPKASDLMLKVSYSIGRGYNLYAASLLDESGDSYGYLLDNTEYRFDVNTVLHADVTVKSVGVVFAMNAGDAAVFYGKDFVRDWNIADVEFGEALPVNVYRTDAKLAGWSLRPLPGVAEEGVYASVDEAFIAAFKKHVESRESFDTPDTLYAVWKTVNNRLTYTVSMANRASEGSFVLANGAAGFGSNEYVIDGSRSLEVPAESDLLFTVEFKQSSEKARYHAISVLPLDSENPVGYLASGDEFNFKSDVRLRAMNVIDAIEFALDVNAKGKNVFFGRDFREFKWTASAYGQELPTGIYRADAKLAGWSFNKKAKPEQAFTTFDDAFEEAYEKAYEKLLETGLMEESLGGNLDWSNIQERYGMDFTQVRTPVLYAVWESATVETKQIVSKSLKQGTLSIVQKVGDSTFTYVVDEKGMKVPSVTDDELMVIAHFESDPAWLLMGEKPLIWKTSTGADTTENDFVGMLNEMPKKVTFSVIAKYIGFHLVFNVDSKETSKEKLFYGDDWVAEDDVTASEHAVLPAVVYSANRCLAGWSVSSKSKSLYTTMNDNLANEIYTAYPNLDETTKVPLYARWSQNVEDCAGYFTRISVEHDKDKVMFVENRDGKEVVHNFNNRGTMLLPEDIVSFDWTLRTAPDSSFMLDSLLMFRGEKIVAKLTEGSPLPGNMEDVVLVPFFGKSNKTPITLVEKSFAQSGNAVQMSFKASEFEVTRKASARVQLIDTTTNVVILDSLLGDSVAMGYADDVVLHVTKPGDYRVVVTIGDEKESDEYDGFFSIKSQIASVAKDSWQMISLAAVDTSALKWDNDQVFYWWDEQGTGDFWQYKRYYRGDEIVKERGAWYSSLKARPLVLRTDLEEDREDIVWELDSVSTGWNLVANPYGWDVSLFSNRPDADKAFDEQSEVTFWRYNAQTSDYEEVHYLKPYEAVWAKVSKKMTWKVSSAPVFNAEEPALESEAPEAGDTVAFEKRILAKASTKDRWTLQAVLSDKNGRKDAWNILGAGNNPFSAEEPPSSMGDHVNFAILDNKKTLAKSIKESSDEMEWTVALSASSDRVGYLKLAGIEGVKAFGYRVYVTVDGNTTEMQENVPLTVYLKSSVKTATVRVAPTARTVVTKKIDGLRTTRLGNRLQVSFNVSEGLAGEKTRVDLMDMKGHVVSTVSAQALNGSNALMLDLPKSGLYMIRVRAGSQQQATKIAVK